MHQTEGLLFNVLLSWLGIFTNVRRAPQIGYDLGFILRKIFTMLVIMAVVTIVMTGPFLRVLLPRAGYFRPQRVEA